MICFGKPEVVKEGNSTRTLKLIKHHVKYDPETVIWIHFKCHQKIHDADKPLTQWIQYTEKEKKLFYKDKKQDEKMLGTIVKWKL
tara:strand:+ start:98 stop:352 length:255 start_codon:yes stop_codon:yes gene_type:complete